MKWGDFLQKYLTIRKGANYKQATLDGEREQFRILGKYLGSEFDGTEIQVTKAQVLGFMGHLMEKGLKPNSIRQRIGGLGPFYKYAVASGWMLKSPMDGIKPPKQQHPALRTLTEEQVEQLFEVIPLDTVVGLRDRTMVELLYGSGLRKSELLNLKVADIDLENMTVRVLGKGGKEAAIPLTRMAVHILRFYLAEVWPHLENDEYLLLNANDGRPITKGCLHHRLIAYGKKIGLGWNLTPHTFRYTICTHLVENGANLRQVQVFMRHDHLNTTARYLNINFQTLAEVHDETHPIANL